MKVGRFTLEDATLERSPDQNDEIYAGDLVNAAQGASVTVGYGRYGPGARLEETLAVHDVMIVLEGGLTVTSGDRSLSAGPGEIVYMPEGERVVIQAGEQGALTAYVTHPHWREARG